MIFVFCMIYFVSYALSRMTIFFEVKFSDSAVSHPEVFWACRFLQVSEWICSDT